MNAFEQKKNREKRIRLLYGQENENIMRISYLPGLKINKWIVCFVDENERVGDKFIVFNFQT